MRLSGALYKKIRRYMVGKFIDSAKVRVRAGNGADGLAKFGGVGGRGGDIVLEATAGDTLDAFYKRWKKKGLASARNGDPSQVKRIFGHDGEPKVLSVPVGVAAYARNDLGGGVLLAELNENRERVVVARGGAGGSPENDFKGQKGESLHLQLDLKLIADVGLVGFPNAGKSTLLKAISNARPKVADYPFTTVRPEVGIIEYPDLTKVSMADLPGLLEGAHINRGMGHSFLRHIERTKLLLMVTDVTGFRLSPQHPMRSCIETIVLLIRELELYDPTLLSKPVMLVINKLDQPGSAEIFEEVKAQVAKLEEVFEEVPEEVRPSNVLQFQHVLGMSAKDGPAAVKELKKLIKNVLREQIMLPNEDDYEQGTV
ncbi:Hypothetical predicted protein [Cloeon dipterum]|uniref:OBG-type G domain-containing protein n=1 Tax=Cloeon dipterum TaxID=197152 RepID=A0A8S1CDH3_9INSE|nr:Hypothetical predicted protein [Cloeon dipterum]